MPTVNDPQGLAALMQRLNAVLNGREAAQSLSLLQRTGLSFPQVVALYALAGSGPQTLTQLASAVHLSLAATSQLVDRLVERGYVERTEAAGDRRFKTIRILKPGSRALQSLHELRRRELSVALSRLPAKVARELRAAVESALAHLE